MQAMLHRQSRKAELLTSLLRLVAVAASTSLCVWREAGRRKKNFFLTNKQTDRQTERQRDRRTEEQLTIERFCSACLSSVIP